MIMFIASSVAEDEAASITNVPKVSNAKAAAGWTIFIGVVAFVYEVWFIIGRFLNFGFSINYRLIYLIVVSVMDSYIYYLSSDHFCLHVHIRTLFSMQ